MSRHHLFYGSHLIYNHSMKSKPFSYVWEGHIFFSICELGFGMELAAKKVKFISNNLYVKGMLAPIYVPSKNLIYMVHRSFSEKYNKLIDEQKKHFEENGYKVIIKKYKERPLEIWRKIQKVNKENIGKVSFVYFERNYFDRKDPRNIYKLHTRIFVKSDLWDFIYIPENSL